MKRRTAAILCIVLLVFAGITPSEASASEGYNPDVVIPVKGNLYRCGDWEFRVLEDGSAEMTAYWSEQESLEIPDRIAGYRVSAIGDYCFSNRGGMCFYTDEYPEYFRARVRTVSVPEGVVSIGDYAFENCFNLLEAVLPESLERIGEGAFDDCAILSVIALPSGLTEIGDYAFRNCGALTHINLPERVRSVGANPFAGCVHLTRITVSPQHPNLVFENGLMYDRTEKKLICCTKAAWDRPPVWPSDILTIGESAFAHAPYRELDLPETLREIGSYAFSDCVQLRELSIPETVRTIGGNPVRGCTGLKTLRTAAGQDRFSVHDDALFDDYEGRLIAYVKLPVVLGTFDYSQKPEKTDLPDEIDAEGTPYRLLHLAHRRIVREYAAVPAYEVPAGTAAIAGYAFYGSQIENILLPDSVSGIGEGAFMQCGQLKQCAIPPSIRVIPDHAFHGCGLLHQLSLPDSLVSIGAFALYGVGDDISYGDKDHIAEIALPDTVMEMGRYAFSRCRANAVRLGAGLTYVPRGAFAFGRFEEITVPESVTEIGEEAFAFCYGIDTITFPSGVTVIPALCCFACTLSRAVIPEEVTYIGDYAFSSDNYYYSTLESLEFPEGLLYLGNFAFKSAIADDELHVPGSLIAMGKSVFKSNSFSRVYLADGLKMIGESMFAYCDVGSVEIPESVCFIGDEAFMSYESRGKLISVRLPNRPIEVDGNPFFVQRGRQVIWPDVLLDADHPNLTLENGLLIDGPGRRVIAWLPKDGETSCTVPDGIEVIGKGAFASADLSGGITLPDSLRRIEARAFSCAILMEIRLPDRIEVIGDEAFADTGLTQITLPEGLLEIGASAFRSTGIREITIPASVRRLGASPFGQDLESIVFEAGEIFLDGELVDNVYGPPLRIVVPDGHPTLETDNGNLYSKTDARLILLLSDRPVREGTRIIETNAMPLSSVPIIPESVELIRFSGLEVYYLLMPECVYVAPGSPAEAIFEYSYGY